MPSWRREGREAGVDMRANLSAMGTAQRPDPTESVRHQLRPLFDQIVIKELFPTA